MPAFPAEDTSLVAPARASPDYFAGALTAGPDRGLRVGAAGQRASGPPYVVITPAGDRADEHVVKLRSPPTAGLQHRGDHSQVGGYLTASLSQVSPGPGGRWGPGS